MKKILFVLSALCVLTTSAFATNPTVTLATGYPIYTADKTIYKFTFSTAIADADSAFIWKSISDSSPFYLGYMTTPSTPDSLIGVRLETTETTADSVRQTLLTQICYDNSCATATVDDEWSTLVTTTLDSAVSQSTSVNPLRSGVPYYVRFILFESDTDKDATQTFTLWLAFPRAKSDVNVINRSNAP